MSTSGISYIAKFFDKEKLMKELIEFEQTAASIDAPLTYLDGVNAVVTRLEKREADLELQPIPLVETIEGEEKEHEHNRKSIRRTIQNLFSRKR